MSKGRCMLCGDVVESKHRHDFVRCQCGESFLDGGDECPRGSMTMRPIPGDLDAMVEDLEQSAFEAGIRVERDRILDLMRARVEECKKLNWITDAQALTAMMKEIAGDE